MAKNLEEARKKIAQLSEDLAKLTKTGKAKIFDVNNMREANQAISTLEGAIDAAIQKAEELEEGFGGITSAIGAALAEMSKTDSAVNRTVKSMRGIKSITQDLANDQSGLVTLSLKELKNKQSKLAALTQEAKEQAEIVASKYKGLDLDKNGNKLYGAALKQRLKSKKITLNEYQSIQSIIAANQNNLSVLDEASEKLEERVELEKDVQRKLGITGGILKGISKIPILGDVFDANEAVEKMENHLRDGGTAVGALGAGFKNIASQIKDGILNSANMVLGVFTFILDALKGMDKSAGDLAKGMNLTYDQGVELNKELRDMAQSTGDIMINQKGLQESLLAINKTMGTNVMISEKNLKTFTKLREAAGLTNEELMGSMKLTAANGKSLKSNVDTILKTTSSLNKQTGVYLNEKDILKDIDKISSATTLSLGKNPKHLAEAAATAKRFGMEMSQLEGIADSLLNFEDSIGKELEAELLLGKDLTLEKARQAALNNDMATLAKEIAQQAGNAEQFGKMNRIQQEAIAKAVGMNRDSLGQTLFIQEQLEGLSADEGARREELLQKRINEVGLAQAQRELEEGGIEKLEQQASVAERFEKTVEKIKETFVNMLDGPLGGVLKVIEKILSSSAAIYGITGAIAGVYAGKMTQGLVSTIAKIYTMVAANTANAAAATTAATATSFGAMIPVILGGVGAIMGLVASFKKADDMLSMGSGKSGYGDRTLFGPEGAIQLNNKDTVIAGTNLFGDDAVSEPGKATEMAGKGEIKVKGSGDMSAVISAINTLSGNLNAIASRPINVSIDGNKVITATTDQKPNESGDAVRKNSFEVQ